MLTSSTQKKIAADMRLASLLAFVFLGMLSTAACGGADGSGNTSADTVAVTISDSTLFAPRAAQAGSVVLQVRNIDSSPRSLHIADSTGRVDSLGQPLAADARGAMTLDLAPGVYEMYSPTSERDSTPGMDVQLTVGEGWGENALSSGSSLRGSLQRRQQ